MSVGIRIDNQLDIPPGIETLDAFRRWVHSDDFPDQGRIDWVGGKLEIEIAPDSVFWHSSPKTEIGTVIAHQVRSGDLGYVFIDKTRIVMPDVDLACEPDVVFISHTSIDDARIKFVQSQSSPDKDSIREIEGPPDLVVEVVSDSSVSKDTERLFGDYDEGGVDEYWLVDAREAELSFQIYSRGPARFEPAATDDNGCQRSEVFDTWYRFTRHRDRHGLWRYDLEERD